MKRYSILAICGILAIAAYAGAAAAQTTPIQLIVTWQAGTYAPPGFPGKVMPTSDSQILVGVDLVNLGKRVDLSSYTVNWYVNENFYRGGVGLARINLTAPHVIGKSSISVRVLVKDYNGGTGKTITIPVVSPEAVVQSSAPSLAAAAAPFNLRVYPYFFNVQGPGQLSFNWSLAGQDIGSGNPFVATKEMAARGPSRLEVRIMNPSKAIERVTKELTIFR